MRLVENVRAARTAPAVVAAVTLIALRLGKTPVLVGNCPGFVGNRMLAPYGQEAEQLVTAEGVPPQRVDAALSLQLGMAMGPLAVGDLAGLEIGQAPRKAQGLYDPERHFVDLLNSKGRIGQKSGSGWYRYDAMASELVASGLLVAPAPRPGWPASSDGSTSPLAAALLRLLHALERGSPLTSLHSRGALTA